MEFLKKCTCVWDSKTIKNLIFWLEKFFSYCGAVFLIREGSHNLMLLIVQEISRKKNLTIPGVGKHIIIDNFQICLRLWAPTQLRMDMVGLKSFFSYCGATFQTKGIKIIPDGTFAAYISHEKNLTFRSGYLAHFPSLFVWIEIESANTLPCCPASGMRVSDCPQWNGRILQ